jgi:hypothetical protein
MENSIDHKTDKSEQRFVEKYGMWIIVIGLLATIIVLKIILNVFSH